MFLPTIVVAETPNDMVVNVKTFLEDRLRYLLAQHGIVTIGVSGGSMPQLFCDAILSIKDLDWRRIRIFMVDERNVEKSHPDSNHGIYFRLMPKELHESIVDVPIEDNPGKTAASYEFYLRKYLLPEQNGQTARFDILLLGVGPDGHTCSLFPGQERLPKITDYNWVSALTDSPKPPPCRVTLTMNTLNNGKNVAFIITGKSKAPIVRGMYQGNTDYPAALVRPINHKLWYLLDKDAASELPESATSSPTQIED